MVSVILSYGLKARPFLAFAARWHPRSCFWPWS